MYSAKRATPIYADDLPNLEITAAEYNAQTAGKKQSSCRNHFYEKLFKLRGMMKTVAGREEAERRHQRMITYMRDLEQECNLTPLEIKE